MAIARLALRRFIGSDTLALQKRMTQCYSLGEYEEALRLATELKNLMKAEHGENHPSYLHTLGSLGKVCQTMGKIDEAVGYAKEMHEKFLSQFGEQHKSTIQSKQVLASAYIAKGKFDVGLMLLHEAFALKQQTSPQETVELTDILIEIGKCYTALQQHEKALLVLTEAKRQLGDKYGYDNILIARVLEVLSVAQLASGSVSEAHENLRTAYLMQREWYGAPHLTTQKTQRKLEELQAKHPELNSQ